ncbi:family 20 glycosylhydrolase [Saccharibacillus sp. CPCC 101409]|uniref:family 20 glycosylhydrolase n=1 Tax=Saccharibacillus sp. CPCC 101409 TaxID=3058041 RepID=UPI002672E4A7|nr:family 20 glycosylhydrolase [Saccharibacillus sp. CPCC 101409]MDO3411094.1 family 20 glycosylhydrolase [Saccharibacillus sp. CPCC 101409]
MNQLLPQPQRLRRKTGKPFRIGKDSVLELVTERQEPRLERHCRRAFPEAQLSCIVGGSGYSLCIGASGSEDGSESQAPRQEAAASSREQGYRLEAAEERIHIVAPDAAGLYYGLQTLLQLPDSQGNIDPVVIEDWPDTRLRAMNYDLRQNFSKPELLIRYLADFARYKINALLIEYEDKFPFRKYPELTHPLHALSEEQLQELQSRAHEHFIEIIPLQQSFGHLEYALRRDRWRHLRETEASIGEICPSRPESYELVTDLLEEMMEAHPDSPYIHLGCDEVYSLCECEECREAFGGIRERAFIAFLNRLIEFAATRGKTPIFWHDMLDKCPPGELAALDPRSVAMIWIYNGREIESQVAAMADKFRALGIGVMGAPAVRSFEGVEHQNYPLLANRTDNLLQWNRAAETLDIGCMVATNWTATFSLGYPYGIFETTWYPMLLHAELSWNRKVDTGTYIARFLERFHGIPADRARVLQGNLRLEDYYELARKLPDEARVNPDVAELIAVMHDYEAATDRSRAAHKYAYRLELYPGDEAERHNLLDIYRRNRRGREEVRPRMTEALERYQPADMAAHYVSSRFYLHDYLERTLYRELGLNTEL